MLEILCLEFIGFRIGGDHSGNPTDYERSVVQRNRSEEATNSVSVWPNPHFTKNVRVNNGYRLHYPLIVL